MKNCAQEKRQTQCTHSTVHDHHSIEINSLINYSVQQSTSGSPAAASSVTGQPNANVDARPKKIYRVPWRTRNIDAEAYDPQIFSIGPYHHNSPTLAQAIKYKLSFLRKVLIGENGTRLNVYKDKMERVAKKVHDYYEEEIEMAGDKLKEMLLIDGCCILFFLKIQPPSSHSKTDSKAARLLIANPEKESTVKLVEQEAAMKLREEGSAQMPYESKIGLIEHELDKGFWDFGSLKSRESSKIKKADRDKIRDDGKVPQNKISQERVEGSVHGESTAQEAPAREMSKEEDQNGKALKEVEAAAAAAEDVGRTPKQEQAAGTETVGKEQLTDNATATEDAGKSPKQHQVVDTAMPQQGSRDEISPHESIDKEQRDKTMKPKEDGTKGIGHVTAAGTSGDKKAVEGHAVFRLPRPSSRGANYKTNGPRVQQRHYDIRPWQNNSVRHDILLMENQLPFFVVQEVYNLATGTSDDSSSKLRESIVENMQKLLGSYPTAIRRRQLPTPEFEHLLHYCHMYFTPTSIVRNPSQNIDQRPLIVSQIISLWIRHCCPLLNLEKRNQSQQFVKWRGAKDLHEAGVAFKPNQDSEVSLLDVKFSAAEGTMEIPTLILEDGTVSLFRNLMAFEQSRLEVDDRTSPDENYFAAYVFFMRELMSTPADVTLLVKKGVVRNLIGKDEEVSDLFSKLIKGIIFDTDGVHYLKPVYGDLDLYYSDNRNKWKAYLKRRYFGNPWLTISMAAATVILLCTVLQTLFTIKA
ncbi:UPF0481 protein [Canna indica]|uniref:UPF0481 protein n=1 Tax=Canna indica TaxID=4628 RepID=A0AAQ3QEX5_9LILI|nr:UPF0481 protein [Canna indica]